MRLAVDRTSIWWMLADSASWAGAVCYRAYGLMLRLDLWAMEHSGELMSDEEAHALWRSILVADGDGAPPHGRDGDTA